MDNDIPTAEVARPFPTRRILNIFFIICFTIIAYYYLFSAPSVSRSFLNKEDITIHVAPNQGLNSIAEELESKSVVRHALVLKALVTVFGASRGVEKGDYLFDKPMSVFGVAWMLAQGDHNIDKVKVTFKKGVTNNEIADLLATKLPTFRRDFFLSDPPTKPSYLFPVTFFFNSPFFFSLICVSHPNTFLSFYLLFYHFFFFPHSLFTFLFFIFFFFLKNFFKKKK